jgi:hypothetical protein
MIKVYTRFNSEFTVKAGSEAHVVDKRKQDNHDNHKKRNPKI